MSDAFIARKKEHNHILFDKSFFSEFTDPLEIDTFSIKVSRAGHRILVDHLRNPYFKEGSNFSKKHQKESIYWLCTRRKFKCLSRVTTRGNKIVKRKNEHNHPHIPWDLNK